MGYCQDNYDNLLKCDRINYDKINYNKREIIMIPEKIYLREAELEDFHTGEKMVSAFVPFDNLNVEYVNLSQIWHDADEIPQGGEVIAVTEDTDVVSGDFDESRWGVFRHSVCMANWDSVIKWVYFVDFLDLILVI